MRDIQLRMFVDKPFQKISEDRVFTLDVESTEKIEILSVKKSNKVSANSTYIGTVGDDDLYASHLELLNCGDYSSYENLDKFTTTQPQQV